MEINLKKVRIADLTQGFTDKGEQGVVGLDGNLDIRPAYQREFVYDEKKQIAVIDTITRGYPLGTLYWVENGDGTYEVLDGQQRILSICNYVAGNYAYENKYYTNLYPTERKAFDEYELMVYVVKGSNEVEKLRWFERINITGEKLTAQELLNINYLGSWLSSAKRIFSKSNCPAYGLGNKYVKGSPIRQEYLETVIDWISKRDGISNVEYMSRHQHDANANEMWLYFNSVMMWVQTTFPKYRKEMLGLPWGLLYNKYGKNTYDPEALEKRINELFANEEVTDHRGIYEFVLSGEDEDLACRLSKRAFSNSDKRTAYERQNGICPICGEPYPIEEMEGHHKVSWVNGGTTTLDNLQMVCKKCHHSMNGVN